MDGLANARDVTEAARGLKAGVLWRSDQPEPGDPAPQQLGQWPPAHVVDLREPQEVGGIHPLAAVSLVHSLPPGLQMNPFQMETEGLTRSYVQLVTAPVGQAALVRAIAVVAGADGPVLVHCSAGKDRTGVTVALALSLVGVDRDAVMADYLRTGPNMPAVIQRLARHWASLGMPVAPERIPHAAVEVSEPAMSAVFDVWSEAPGGVVEWYLSAGGAASTLDALQERLLV